MLGTVKAQVVLSKRPTATWNEISLMVPPNEIDLKPKYWSNEKKTKSLVKVGASAT